MTEKKLSCGLKHYLLNDFDYFVLLSFIMDQKILYFTAIETF